MMHGEPDPTKGEFISATRNTNSPLGVGGGGRGYNVINPKRAARLTASVRLATPSLA